MLPDLGRISVVGPCELMKGFVPYAKFPEILGKFSSSRKAYRLIRELKEGAGHQLYAAKMSIQNEYIPLIYDHIIILLDDKSDDKAQSINEAAQMLFDLNYTMDQSKENILGLLVNEKKTDLYNVGVEPATKAAFTKAFNAMNQSSIKAKKAKAGPGGGGGGGIGFGSKFDPDV